jgi:hypothetical protein
MFQIDFLAPIEGDHAMQLAGNHRGQINATGLGCVHQVLNTQAAANDRANTPAV